MYSYRPYFLTVHSAKSFHSLKKIAVICFVKVKALQILILAMRSNSTEIVFRYGKNIEIS